MIIEKLDYRVIKEMNEPVAENTGKKSLKPSSNQYSQLVVLGILIAGIYLIIKNTIGFSYIPEISPGMGYGILFAAGLMTSIHCVAMCGGINLSLCASYQYNEDAGSKYSKLKPNIMYNAGRVLSYTVLGGVVGAVGAVFSLSNAGKAFISMAAGAFMIIMGLNMLNLFPFLRKINPHVPKSLAGKINGLKKEKGPFLVGVLNGFMPCGPLQAMQIYALGTGSMITGAISMFLFSLGTVPLLFAFGALGSILSTKFTKQLIKVSAMLVIVLGLVMTNRGLAFTGITFQTFAADSSVNSEDSSILKPFGKTSGSGESNTAVVNGDVQEITTTLESGKYTPITVQNNIPVKWTIRAEAGSLNGCNRQIVIPQYGIQQDLAEGDNVITFTPDKTGKFGYSCWMGMIRSSITVTAEEASKEESSKEEASLEDEAGAAADTSDNSENSEEVDNTGLPAGCCGN